MLPADALFGLHFNIAVTSQHHISELVDELLPVIRGRGMALDVVGIDGTKSYDMLLNLLHGKDRINITSTFSFNAQTSARTLGSSQGI